ncbi:hypothetical protein CDAR_491371 [Caerostris darwini]|uniref:Uncharacterized protein n=1 Tax=Caerostris darwini TaxID=1538125 RepID=A0AAV4X8I7_9ARAC|nr:hypothetical protein CDAR_491371 [Caerostris darwini]
MQNIKLSTNEFSLAECRLLHVLSQVASPLELAKRFGTVTSFFTPSLHRSFRAFTLSRPRPVPCRHNSLLGAPSTLCVNPPQRLLK